MKRKMLIAALVCAAMLLCAPSCQRSLPLSGGSPSGDQSEDVSELPDGPSSELPDDQPDDEEEQPDDPSGDASEQPDDQPDGPSGDTSEQPDDPSDERPDGDKGQPAIISEEFSFSSFAGGELADGEWLIEGYAAVNCAGGIKIVGLPSSAERGGYLSAEGGECIKFTLPCECVVECEVYNLSIFSSRLALSGEGEEREWLIPSVGNAEGGNGAQKLSAALPAGQYVLKCSDGLCALLSLSVTGGFE